MDQELAQRIITELTRFTQKKYAVTNQYGEVLFSSEDFSITHNPLDIKSKKAYPILYDNKKIAHLHIDENVASLKEIGPILKSMAELIVHEKYYTEVLSKDERQLDNLMYDFLKTEELKPKDVEKSFVPYGIDATKNRLAIIIQFEDSHFIFSESEGVQIGERDIKVGRIKRQIKFLFESLYTNHKDNIVAYLGGNDFVVLKDMGENPEQYLGEFRKTVGSLFYNLKNELRASISIGVGGFKKGTKGIKGSFEEAETALRFGKQNWGKGKIFHYDSFGVVAPLFSGISEENITSSVKLIKKLKKHPELFESLNVFLDLETSLTKTASKLQIHRNTLVYRLEKIAEVTGLDPREFKGAFELQLALIVDRYSK